MQIILGEVGHQTYQTDMKFLVVNIIGRLLHFSFN